MKAVEQQLQSELGVLAREHGLDAEWRSVDGRASVLVPQHARYADLCILGQGSRDVNASIGYGFSEQVCCSSPDGQCCSSLVLDRSRRSAAMLSWPGTQAAPPLDHSMTPYR